LPRLASRLRLLVHHRSSPQLRRLAAGPVVLFCLGASKTMRCRGVARQGWAVFGVPIGPALPSRRRLWCALRWLADMCRRVEARHAVRLLIDDKARQKQRPNFPNNFQESFAMLRHVHASYILDISLAKISCRL